MKKLTSLLLALAMLFTALTLSGCGWFRLIPPSPYFCLPFEIKTDKTEYDYGEEVSVEVIFCSAHTDLECRDGYTYEVKLKESPYYEIIGSDKVTVNGYESDEPYEGIIDNFEYWYRASFKVRITKKTDEMKYLDIGVKCLDNTWLDEWYEFGTGTHTLCRSNDPEYPYAIYCMGFTADDDGVEFMDPLTWKSAYYPSID